MTVHSNWTQLVYTAPPMPGFMERWRLCSAHMDSIDAPIDDGLLITLFVELFGDCAKVPYGAVLF